MMIDNNLDIRRMAANTTLQNNPLISGADIKVNPQALGMNINVPFIEKKDNKPSKEDVKFIRLREDGTLITDEKQLKQLTDKFGNFVSVDTQVYKYLSYFTHKDYDLIVSYQAIDKAGEDGQPLDDSKIVSWRLVAYVNDKYYLFDTVMVEASRVIFRSYTGYTRASMNNNADILVDKVIEFKRIPIPKYDRVCILPLDRNEEEGITDGSTHKQLDSGLFVPDKQKVIGKYGERRVEYEIDYDWGIIVAMGQGDISRDQGNRLPLEYKILDKVIIPPNYGSPFFIDDVEYKMVRDSDIMCKIEY